MPCSRCSVNGLECIFKENPKKRSVETKRTSDRVVIDTFRPTVGGGSGGKIKATNTGGNNPIATTAAIIPAAPLSQPQSYLQDLSPSKSNSWLASNTYNNVLPAPLANYATPYYGQNSPMAFLKAVDTSLDPYGAKLSTQQYRTRFWQEAPGMSDDIPPFLEQYPPQDLTAHLVQLYFAQTQSLCLPLVHRAAFFHNLADPQRRQDPYFACLAHTIFAVASRISNDPRVIPAEANDDGLSAGTHFFTIARRLHGKMSSNLLSLKPVNPDCLVMYLQASVLLSIYVHATAHPFSAWAMIGTAMRLGLDFGLHKASSSVWTGNHLDNEVKRRVFWCIYILDRQWSRCYGRPFAVPEDEIDLPLPSDVDDDELEDPTFLLTGHAPPAKTRRNITAFIHLLRLYRLMARDLRYNYEDELRSWRKSADYIFQEDEMNLDAGIWADQAAVVQSTYQMAVYVLHRPWQMLRADGNSTGTNAPGTWQFTASILSWMMAAHAIGTICKRMSGRYLSRSAFLTVPQTFSAGMTLLVSRRQLFQNNSMNSTMSTAARETMVACQNCITALQGIEDRFALAGKFVDMLCNVRCQINLDTRKDEVKKEYVGLTPNEELAIDGLLKAQEDVSLESLLRGTNVNFGLDIDQNFSAMEEWAFSALHWPVS